MMLLNRFTYEGKTYTATPASHVRIGDTVLRVVKTDAEGNAEVEPEPNKKRHAGAVEATENAAPEAEKKPGDAAESNLPALKAAWAEKDAEAARVRAEQAAIEVDIARELVRLKSARGDVPTVMLGEPAVRYKAQKTKGDATKVSLVRFSVQNARDC